MKQVQIQAFGQPETAARVVDVPARTIQAGDDVLVRVQFAPVGPADIGTLWGGYPRPYPDSVVPGVEAIGVVEALGADVKDLKVGDRVLAIRLDCWSEQLLLKRSQVAKVSSSNDILQQCNLKVNGGTALLLLQKIVDLKPGDWLVQNAANSTVGQYIVQLAKARGIKTVNIVRNASAFEHLKQLGGDVVIIDGPETVAAIHTAIGGAPINLGIDCVGGEASEQLADILSVGGTIVVYGALSLQPVQIQPLRFISKDIRVRGFWITPWLNNAPIAEVQSVISELDELVAKGTLKTEVASVYPLTELPAALTAAGSGGRNGKVVLDFQGS
ncbi:zinc-dependent alcohol dehydrogenase family protein [Pseudomonas sp. TH34]|uniref:zinc-dependent alcohol dehydrogenase family protein n=1 Tax=Pseudomonas sp. TH34 TaxID=2796399 RepID=UPI001912BE85|nr:zinc-dependent alcohol dehydrogenase family protein [Pseudomonas sp. TH34]MBK5410871.1 zinc-dependent alcohol dehydrogenase family protein [Pseudomonas sp. TH34]